MDTRRTTRTLIIIAALAAAAASWGCSAEAPGEQPQGTAQAEAGGLITFRLGPVTRGSGTAPAPGEDRVRSIRIYLYDTDAGRLDAVLGEGWDPSGGGLSASVRHGHKRVVAVANQPSYPSAAQAPTPSSLLEGHLLTLTGPDGSGEPVLPLVCDMEVHFTPYSSEFAVPLAPAAARVRLRRVANRLDPPNDRRTVRVLNAFLSNLAGDRPVGGGPHVPRSWLNRFGRDGGSPPAVIGSAAQSATLTMGYTHIGAALAPGGEWSASGEGGMYAFPNGTQEDRTGPGDWVFTPRFTRLVVTAEIGGLEYYYPVSLTGLLPGHSYDVSLTLTRLGSDDPDTFSFMESTPVGPGVDGGTGGGGSVDIEF